MNYKLGLKYLIILIGFIILFNARVFILTENEVYNHVIRIINGLTIIVLIIIINRQIKNSNIVNLKEYKIHNGKFLLFPLAFVILFLFLSISNSDLGSINGEMALAVIATLILAAAEEFVFRFYFPSLLSSDRFSIKKTIIFSSILFSLAHSLNFIRMGPIGAINQVISAFFLGILLISIAIISKNLYIAIGFHFFFNLPFTLSNFNQSNETLIKHNKETIFSTLLSIVLFHLIFSPLYFLAFYMYKKALSLLKSHTRSIIE